MFDGNDLDWASVSRHIRRRLAEETSDRRRLRIVATWMCGEPPEICRQIMAILEAEHPGAIAWAQANRRLVHRIVLEYMPECT